MREDALWAGAARRKSIAPVSELPAEAVFLRVLRTDTAGVELVEELWRRIKTGQGNTSEVKRCGTTYLNLGHLLIGSNAHFNCKSGKDRTGLQDSEAKFIAHELYQA